MLNPRGGPGKVAPGGMAKRRHRPWVAGPPAPAPRSRRLGVRDRPVGPSHVPALSADSNPADSHTPEGNSGENFGGRLPVPGHKARCAAKQPQPHSAEWLAASLPSRRTLEPAPGLRAQARERRPHAGSIGLGLGRGIPRWPAGAQGQAAAQAAFCPGVPRRPGRRLRDLWCEAPSAGLPFRAAARVLTAVVIPAPMHALLLVTVLLRRLSTSAKKGRSEL